MMKKVSVIMGIYNCAETLEESIMSILHQTYDPLELILCDDGSSDATHEIANDYQQNHPDKIKLLRNPMNVGLNETLNRCLKVASGEYIARQDSDDVSLPDRLEKEVQALDERTELAFISTAMTFFDQSGDWGVTRPAEYPKNEDLMQAGVFAHAASMMRRTALLAVGGYSVSKRLIRVEDYHLWYKMYRAGYRGANLAEALYRCRDDKEAANRRKFKYRVNECYVKWLIFRDLKLNIRFLPLVIRPILTGMLPKHIYIKAHRKRFQNK